jgi:glycerol uptake facilitator-like aquaporin
VWLAGKLAWHRAAAYVVAQLIGALLAAWSLTLVFSANPLPGTPALAASVSPLGGLLVETVLTVILLIAVFGTAIDPRAPKIGGIAIGFAVAADIFMGGPLTGAAMNPARWFGPAAVNGMWDNAFVWIVGPLLGAAIVALAYRYVFAEEASLARTPAEPMA